MTGWRSRALGLLLLAAVTGPVIGPVTGPARAGESDGPVPSRVLFTIRDTEVFESSGLVDRGDVVWTTNDSGDDAVLYGLDAGTGEAVRRTSYAEEVRDVEALAPGPPGTLWAGDIGDNRQRRDDVVVYRVREQDGDQAAARFTLTYPDGAHDAETMLVHPRTGRLLVVSKSVFGGTVYLAPRRLREGDEPQPMTAFAQVPGLVTDGAFYPDGRHVLLRTYGTASVYTYPGFDLVGTVRLPRQNQGEGIAVGADGRVLVSTEGVAADVLQVTVPAAPAGGPEPSRRPPVPAAVPPDPEPRDAGDWTVIALVAAGLGGLVVLTVRASRIRAPRR